MESATAASTYRGFITRTLPKAAWTHEAHVAVCWSALQQMPPNAAMRALRDGIRQYNEATGVANTPTDGYHETITAYYVGAVAAIDALTAAAAIAAPECTRSSPMRHWTTELLMSPAARAEWTTPDLAPLSWDATLLFAR